MKTTASRPNTPTQRQVRNSRLNPGGSATSARGAKKAAESASQTATARAKRGEPLEAKRQSDRSPKQENL